MDQFLQLAVSGILTGGIYILMASGLTLILGAAKIVNFAHGEFIMLGMYFAYWLFTQRGISPYLSVILAIPIFAVIGIVYNKLIIKPTLKKPHLSQVFATLGSQIVITNMALFLWSGDFRSITTPTSTKTFKLGSLFLSQTRLTGFLVAVLIMVILMVFLQKTITGKAINALAQDLRAAQLIGADVDKLIYLILALGISLAGVAGVLLLPQLYAYPSIGLQFVLMSFVIVVLGGLGSMPGAILGGLLVGIAESFVGFINPSLKEVAYFLLFMLVIVIRPDGLLGVKGSHEEALR